MRVFAAAALSLAVAAQPAPSHVTIPFLANATKPTALEFEAAECDVEAGGQRMACAFQQVFLTTSDLAPDTCLVTTNQYERTFTRETATRWVSRQGPEGSCDVYDVVTLEGTGDGRWTMDVRRIATRDAAECRGGDEPETFTWQNIRRPLPCRFVQPGALGTSIR